jgi:hypothetical protein
VMMRLTVIVYAIVGLFKWICLLVFIVVVLFYCLVFFIAITLNIFASLLLSATGSSTSTSKLISTCRASVERSCSIVILLLSIATTTATQIGLGIVVTRHSAPVISLLYATPSGLPPTSSSMGFYDEMTGISCCWIVGETSWKGITGGVSRGITLCGYYSCGGVSLRGIGVVG